MSTPTTKPFLLLSTRPEDDMAAQEHQSFIRLTGLSENTLIQHRVEQTPLGEVDLSQWAGIFLGGSPFNSTDTDKSDLQLRVENCLRSVVGQALEVDFPVFGACFGVGTIAGIAGGIVDRTYGEPAGCITIHQTPAGREDPILAGMPDRFAALVGHKEACSRLPENSVLLVEGEACPIQMFRIGANIYVTQFHPELERDSFIARLNAYKHGGYYGPDEYDRVVATLDGHDLSVAPTMLKNFARIYATGA
ncbi:glutamine amidotransferase [Corynebacterium mendelii]|uniref:glutamine amidotransferase n=1 Tax=Corynebacterium mendelii TaxID=2765362 RepID=UPI002ED2C4C4